MTSQKVTLQSLADGQKSLVVGQKALANSQKALADSLKLMIHNQEAMRISLKADIKAVQDDVGILKASQLGLAVKVDDLKAYTVAGFETMDGRFDRLEDRADKLEAAIDGSFYEH